MPEWTNGATPVSEELHAERMMNQLLTESLADVEAALARDDQGWATLDSAAQDGRFTREGRRQASDLAEVMAVANPLIKRGLGLRVAYIWGQGVTVHILDDGAEGQDVDAVVQEFLNRNEDTLSGSEAHEDLERNGLGVCGEVFLAFPTDPLTGEVNVRRIQPDEITDIITHPDDSATPWYYRREWTTRPLDPTTGLPSSKPVVRVEMYPAIGYDPAVKPKMFGGKPIRWTIPVLHKAVNRPRRSDRGVGDAFAALPWARMSKDFLEGWALLMRALSRFAWQKTTRGDKTRLAAQKITSHQQANPYDVGATAVNAPGETLEAIPKSGATIDATSGRPLQTMVASALGVPVTMLLGDPGATGARAVAETLDQPTELEMGLRRMLWSGVFRTICDYVIDQSVIAPLGVLKGSIQRVGDTRVVTLPPTDGRLVEIGWPDWDSTPIDVAMKAVTSADQLDKLPPLTIVRLALAALKVEHPDEIIDEITDDDGNFLPPAMVEQATLQRMARQ